MATEFERHDVNFEKQEYKCYRYLCNQKGISVSEGIRKLIQDNLKVKENVGIISRGIDNQRQAIEKRAKEKDPT